MTSTLFPGRRREMSVELVFSTALSPISMEVVVVEGKSFNNLFKTFFNFSLLATHQIGSSRQVREALNVPLSVRMEGDDTGD